jgi:hypothetical protein
MQPPPLASTAARQSTARQSVPPVLLVKAQPNQTASAGLPLFEDKKRLLSYGKWAGLALLGLLVLSVLFGEGDSAGSNSTAAPSNYEGSYEDRMNAGIAELGGTYDSSSGTMTTNRW